MYPGYLKFQYAESKDVQRAAECRSLFYVLQFIRQDEPDLGEYFQRHTSLAHDFLGVYMVLDQGSVSNGEVSDVGQFYLDKLAIEYFDNGKSLENRLKSCIGWSVAVMKYLQSFR